MKKNRGIVVLLLTAFLTIFFCYSTVVGVGPTHTGAAKHIKTGLDLAGGVSITYESVDKHPSKKALDDTVYKLQKRVEQYSTEAQVYKEGENRINVEIPGVTDANAILEDLGKPGSLVFINYLGKDGKPNFGPGKSESGFVLTRPLSEIKKEGSVVLEGNDIADAEGGAYQQQSTKEYAVSLTLTKVGKEKFAKATKENVGKQIAIVYDNGVLSAPNVKEPITGGKAQIDGMKNIEEAKSLASYIRIGSLSLELKEIRSSVVAAQLGVEAINTSIKAGLIGLAIVIIFMAFVYRVPGLVAGLALIIYTNLMLLTLNAFDITLTLPGIAGIILGIGMAVDANVIIYARIREEIGRGLSVRSAIKSGYSKAFSAIFDGNITTLIAAIVLMMLGTGPVKGFAYTLELGIVLSMFTSLIVSRIIINALFAVGVKAPKFYGKTSDRNPINFVKHRIAFFIISLIIVISGPVTMYFYNAHQGKALNYSLEFSGGTATNVTFNKNLSIKDIDSKVSPLVESITGDKNVQPTKVVGTNQVLIKTRALNLKEREKLNKALVKNFGVDEKKISAESISATVSNEMRKDAVVAVIVATICMLLYIWIRFKDIRFASSAVLALLHDVLVVLAFYAISRISVGNTFIACMLTIVGYSINATIVIFDRIRENLANKTGKYDIDLVVNQSITQTLTRSIYTSFTTFVMVAILYVMGVSSIREFAAPLMVGIICGAYSSVCITGALWLVLRKRFPGKLQKLETKETSKGASKTSKHNVQQTVNSPKEPKKKNRKRVQERLQREQENKENN